MPATQTDINRAINEILRLRRIERLAETDLRTEIASVREFLEDLVGPTVRPADAARLLGVSQPALDRWVRKGEVSALLTPQGRREIPLSELVDLLDELEQARLDNGGGRPLARVIRNRQRRAAKAIDLDRLFPRRQGRTHRIADLHSLAYHRLVADRLDESAVEEARRRLARWISEERIDPRWAEAWREVLAMPRSRIARTISADTTRGRELRQTSPFAGALTEQERQYLGRAVEERFG